MFGQTINRARPAMPVGAYQTYSVGLPFSQWRQATCDEVDCGAYRNGWHTIIDERTEHGMAQAYYIRRESKRGFREHRNEAGLTVFSFPPGQRCFASDTHRVPSRPPLYVVRGGDWRRNLGVLRRHTKPEHWVEDFALHQHKLATVAQRG